MPLTGSMTKAKQPHDIIFVNPAHHTPDYYNPIGIGMLATLVRQKGYRTATLDLQREVIDGEIPWPEDFFSIAEMRLSELPSKIYGFTVMNVGLPWAVRLAKIVRRLHPSASIVFGGPHATLLGEALLDAFPEIDIIATNEGDRIIVELVAALLANDKVMLRAIPNLLIRGDKGIIIKTAKLTLSDDLDSLPLIDIDSQLLSKVGIISVEAGRGCPYHCSFCSSHAIWTRKPRFKSAQRLVEEAAYYLKDTSRNIVISYEHDDFLANRPLFFDFVEFKRRSGHNFKYTITTRINHITDEVRGLLASSGCVSVFVGLETASERIQITSEKYLTVSPLLSQLDALLASGIHVSTNFIVGFPGETWQDLMSSFDMMLAICWLGGAVNISIMCPEPGSQLYELVPKIDHVLLTESDYVEELTRGGISLTDLKEVERFHLTTINNGNFDIIEIARLARSMQFLMAEFPLALYLAKEALNGTEPLINHVVFHQRRCRNRITAANVFDVFIDVLRISPHKRALEFLLYEQSRASLKQDGATTVSQSAFAADMPAAYYRAVERIPSPLGEPAMCSQNVTASQ